MNLRLTPTAQDGLLAAAASAVPLVVVAVDERGLGPGTRLLWALLVLATCAPLALRRRFPLLAAAACAVASTGAALVAGRDTTFVVVMLAIGLAAFDTRVGLLPLTAGAVAWTGVFALLGGGALDLTAVTTYVGLGLAPVGFGYALRLQAERALDRLRLQSARDDVALWEERTRIARDVHDAVGHHLSAIRLQSLGARRVVRDDQGAAERALAAIADLSQRALGDIRLLLDRLHDETAATPGLAELSAMAARLGSPDLRVDVAVDPVLAAPPAVQSCAYRVVQEALTNVVRHSGARRADVRVTREGDDLVVTVEDGGPARPREGAEERARAGGGVAGMRGRVAVLGGSLHAGRHGPGWRVRAVLPLPPDGAGT